MTRTREAGFTLVEALVALTILALALTAFYQALSQSTRGAALAQAREETLTHALNHLERLGVDTRIGSGSGAYADGATWQLQVAPLAGGASPNVRAYWVELAVRDKAGATILTLRTAKVGVAAP